MDNTSEVCLEQRVERLYESGLTTAEIAREMGVEEGWVEALISLWNPEVGGEDV